MDVKFKLHLQSIKSVIFPLNTNVTIRMDRQTAQLVEHLARDLGGLGSNSGQEYHR